MHISDKYKVMDPHSRRSQFNHRAPKVGPPSRNIETPPSKHPEQPKMPPKKSRSSTPTTATASFLVRRPIATNSRVKQDEIFKRDMYLSFVTNALQQKATGVADSFDELVAQFSIFSSSSLSSSTSKRSQMPNQQGHSPVDTAQIRLWLVALSHVVSRLERTHATLVDAIVNMPWMTLDNATVKSYTVFIGMLLSARPEYLSLVLAKIAAGFTYQSGIQALDFSMPSTSSSPPTRRVVYDRLHFLLQHLLSLIPTLPSTLQSLLIRNFPHKRQSQIAQTTYIRNLLRLSGYCPELSDRILATIVDRAIQIDVEIQIEIEELEEENLNDHDVFEIDPFDVVIGQEVGSSVDESDSDTDDEADAFSDLSSEADLDEFEQHVEVPTNVRHIQEMVKKLDAILMLLFEHFERTRVVSAGKEDLEKNGDSRPLSPLGLPPLPPLPPLEATDSSSLNTPLIPSISPFVFPLSPFANSSPSALDSLTSSTTTSTATTQRMNKSPLRSQFHSLLSIFDRTILRTFKSRYTQFLVFWYASLDPEFADVFQGMLVDRALMHSSAPVVPPPQPHEGPSNSTMTNGMHTPSYAMTSELTRAAAASYIGSFVSRAKFVDKDGTRRVVGVLCEYLRAHLEGVEAALRVGFGSTEKTSAAVGAILASGQHTVFYAVAQAVFLIFCFRWRDLVLDDEVGDELELNLSFGCVGGFPCGGKTSKVPSKDRWMPELAVIKRVVVSVLNPLKVCSANVVLQFSRVAQATDFIYCYTILDANKRSDSTTSPSRGVADASVAILNPTVLCDSTNAELNTFFPFDPYRLPKSNVFIQSVYREWSSVAIEDEGDDEDEDEDDVVPVDFTPIATVSCHLDIPRNRAAAENNDDGGLGESLVAMSISPARMAISVSACG
ncbi:hypothetical protein NLJ89_g4025 [Agrocybe chaxingu]|uniref:RNA polymerase I-specific transcription initiation factor RRN3 n=1 Tax=Agrocybe chaxingu TaxID=84603 RepID=A0A9W8K3N3_9AGAR|nr:hypothetical protein NLJ89_g4025 [Agrocybe chaxingu]